MENDGKHLILDKNVFFGTSTKKLCQFASNHFLVIPEVLIYECATAPPEENKQSSLERLTNTICDGAYVCPSIGLIVEKETQQGCPYGSIEDRIETNKIREASKIEWAEQRAHQKKDDEMKRTERILEWANNVAKRRQGISQLEPIRQCTKAANKIAQKDKQYLYQNYLQAIDLCLSVTESTITKDWIMWHYKRLTLLYVLLLGDKKDIPLEKMEHHLQDSVYTTLLCRADGLLTCDKEQTLLAKTAFPQKDIFASIDAVPEKYVCNRSRC